MKINDFITRKCWRKQNNEVIIKIFGIIIIIWVNLKSCQVISPEAWYDDDDDDDDNCFCGMVYQRKTFYLISIRDHCQRSSPLWNSNTLQAGFEPPESLTSGLVEWSCPVVIPTATLRHHIYWGRDGGRGDRGVYFFTPAPLTIERPTKSPARIGLKYTNKLSWTNTKEMKSKRRKNNYILIYVY